MWRAYQLIATAWFLVSLCFLLVSLRLYVQLTTRYRPWREILVVYAWLMQAADTSISTVNFSKGILYGQGDDKATPELRVLWRKLGVADQFTWTLGCCACRALLLLMYHDLCPRHVFPKMWWAINFMWAFLASGILGSNFIHLLLICYPNPISAYWTIGATCDGILGKYFLVGMSATFIGDVIIYIIPIVIVFRLQNLRKIQRIGAAAMFAIGFINVGSLLVMLAIVVVWKIAPKHINITRDEVAGLVRFVQIIQLPTALVVICIPQLHIIGRWRVAGKLKVGLTVSVNRDIGTVGVGPMGSHPYALEGDLEKDILSKETLSRGS